ncbi:MAG: hypothetical protein V1838_01230 [Patescibacteria group bacterium]
MSVLRYYEHVTKGHAGAWMLPSFKTANSMTGKKSGIAVSSDQETPSRGRNAILPFLSGGCPLTQLSYAQIERAINSQFPFLKKEGCLPLYMAMFIGARSVRELQVFHDDRPANLRMPRKQFLGFTKLWKSHQPFAGKDIPIYRQVFQATYLNTLTNLVPERRLRGYYRHLLSAGRKPCPPFAAFDEIEAVPIVRSYPYETPYSWPAKLHLILGKDLILPIELYHFPAPGQIGVCLHTHENYLTEPITHQLLKLPPSQTWCRRGGAHRHGMRIDFCWTITSQPLKDHLAPEEVHKIWKTEKDISERLVLDETGFERLLKLLHELGLPQCSLKHQNQRTEGTKWGGGSWYRFA